MDKEWKVNGVKDSVDCRIFNVERVEKTNPNGEVGDYIRIKSKDWAIAIVHTIKDNKFILVNQYRHGSDMNLTEFPCGIVEENETPMDAAIREAEEEIGLEKSKIVSIKRLYEKKTNPGFMSNSMFAFLIEADEFAINFVVDKEKQDKDEFLKSFILNESGVSEVMNHSDTSVMMWSAWNEAKKRFVKE
jgi:8-oxo-dGTP pyrophosphatase MutT (NUDIX family)